MEITNIVFSHCRPVTPSEKKLPISGFVIALTAGGTVDAETEGEERILLQLEINEVVPVSIRKVFGGTATGIHILSNQ
jgi:hypothetical protein